MTKDQLRKANEIKEKLDELQKDIDRLNIYITRGKTYKEMYIQVGHISSAGNGVSVPPTLVNKIAVAVQRELITNRTKLEQEFESL